MLLRMRQLKPAVAAALLGSALLAAGSCGRTEEAKDFAKNPPAAEKPAVSLPESVLHREELLIAAVRAASDYAAGIDDSQRQRDLRSRKFEIRIRFGCEGLDHPSPGPMSATFDQQTRALDVTARPDLSAKDQAVAAVAGKDFEAVEGFWIPRPWLLSAACPRLPAITPVDQAAWAEPAAVPDPFELAAGTSLSAPAAPRPTVGIAQFFTTAQPRSERRSGRGYQVTKKLDKGDEISGGFDLVLAGRLKELEDKRVIACNGDPAAPPTCVISADFEEVWIERGDTREKLADWTRG